MSHDGEDDGVTILIIYKIKKKDSLDEDRMSHDGEDDSVESNLYPGLATAAHHIITFII